MTDSKLKLNADKTEFLIIGTPKQCGKLDVFFPTCILNQTIIPAASAKNLGVTFDKNFNFRQHISQTCRCCFYHIRDLRRIRRYMSLSVAKTIATALVSSRLDYCNSLLHNIAIKDITKLQRVQNCLARVVTRSPRFSRSVPLLKSLHWLPVQYRIFLRSVQLPIKPFQPNNLHIYIQCSLQQDSPDSFGRLVLIYFLFPELRQTLELELSRLPHQPCGIHSPTA